MTLGLEGDILTMLIEKNGWEFCFDKDKTLEYYKSYTDLCQCEYCQNYYQNIDYIPSNVRSFLEQFGIDIAKPIEQVPVMVNKLEKTVDNILYFVVVGKAISTNNNDDIDLGPINIEIVPDELSPNTDITKPYFVLAVQDIWLPWTINCKPDDI